MKRDLKTIVVITLLSALALPRGALAQTYELPAGVVGSGGGTATSTSYSLSGTVGQPAADIGLSSDGYGHDGGFWPAAQALTVPQVLLANTGSAYFNPYSGSARIIGVQTASPLDGNNSSPAGYNLSAGSFTIEAHVKPMEDLAEGDTVIIAGHLYGASTTALAYGLILYRPVGSATQVAFVVSNGLTVGAVNNPITPCKWSHVAGVYDGSNLTLYVDGAGKGAISYVTGGADPGSYGFYMGLGTRRRLVGFVDELRIWDVARTSTEINDNMMTTLTGTEPGLRDYWPLNNRESFTDPASSNTYEIARDYSPNQNHLAAFDDITFMAAVPFGGPFAPELVATGEHYAVAGQGFAFNPTYGGGPTTTVSLSGPAGMSYNDAASAAVWTPNTDQVGRHTFTLEAKNTVGSVQQDYSIWVDAVVAEAREHNTNTIAMSVYNNGAIGDDAFSRDSGSGFVYDGLKGLYAGELVIGTVTATDTVISGGLRVNDFATRTGIEDMSSTRVSGSTGYHTVFDDQRSLNPLGVTVSQWTHDADDNDYVTLIYSVVNSSASTLSGLHIGLALDWDVGKADLNFGGYDAALTLAYVFESDATTNAYYYGATAIIGEVSGAYVGSANFYDEALSTTIYGQAMTTLDYTPTADGDIRTVLAVGPFVLAPGGRQNVAFALVAGNNLADLMGNAAAAHANFVSYPVARTHPPKTVGGDFAELQGEALTRGATADVYFEYGETEAYGSTVNADQSPLTSSGFNPVSATISGLVTGKEYHYRLVVDNGAFVQHGGDRVFITTGSVDIVTETETIAGDGTVDFPNTNVSLGITFDQTGEGTIEVFQTGTAPGGTPVPSDMALVAERYWEINYDGGGTFSNVEMTFILGAGVITSEDLADITNLKLLRRADESVSWDLVGSTLRATESSVTFTGLTSFSQYAVTRLVEDTEAPDIATPTTAPTSPVDIRTPITVTAVVDDNVSAEVHLHYSPCGGPSYVDSTMRGPFGAQANEYRSTIPTGAVTVTGVVFYVRAVDAAGNDSTSATQFVDVIFDPGYLTTNIPGSDFSGGFPRDRWRLISVPAAPTDPSVSSIIGAVDALGAQSDTSWRIFAFSGDESDPWDEATNYDFSRGESYWLYQRVQSGVTFDAGGGESDALESYTITLQPGWNMISSPYPSRTSLPPELLSGADYYGPFTYTGSGTDQSGWTSRSELLPWGGVIIHNGMVTTQYITLNAATPSSTPKALLAKGKDAIPDGWLLHLMVQGEMYFDSLTAIGRLAGATEQLDRFDNPEPPYIDGFVSLAMERPDWGANMPRFASDVRSLVETDGVWELALYVKGERGPITLSSDLQGDLPAGDRIVLLDVLTREVHDLLAGKGPVTIADYREDFPYHLKVIAGSVAYVEHTTQEILTHLPSDFALAHNYPNPFNPVTHLRYSLLRPASVTLKIYNLLGQEVITLVDDWRDLGHYKVIWDGRDRFGGQVASGVYFAAYMAEGRIYTRKMVLMK